VTDPALLYLVHDIGDPAVAKRVRMLQAGGASVTLMGFRRDGTADIADCPVIDLGRTHNGRFIQRIIATLREVFLLARYRPLFEAADIILARNLEMLALAVRGRSLCREKPNLIYEVLDIHRLLLGTGLVGRSLRRLEGWLAKRASALIVSSPAFVPEYFQRLSSVRLPIRLVENKVFIGGVDIRKKTNLYKNPSPPPGGESLPRTRSGGNGALVERSSAISEVGEGECRESDAVSIPAQTPAADPLTLVTLSAEALSSTSPLPHMGGEGIFIDRLSKNASVAPPWKIGWFGAIRCRQSLQILSDLVRHSDGAVEVIIRGKPALDQFEEFIRTTGETPGLAYHGPYDEADLATIYGAVHFTWAIDRFEAGQNSAWLLPNRLYEGGLYGAVPLVEAGVETGRFVRQNNIGVALANPLPQSLARFFATLTPARYQELAIASAAVPRDIWVCDRQDCQALVDFLEKGS
jgi:hypothetical protein